MSINDLILIYNNLLCSILLGGIYVEAIDSKDIVSGSLHNSNMIWPVNLGESLSANMHGRLRMKLSNNMESIFLMGACDNSKSVRELHDAVNHGNHLLKMVPNLSPYYLIHGISELSHRNWSSATSSLWINAEQLTDFIWLNIFLTDPQKNPAIPTRLKTMQQDHRTYSASVKQEILYQVGILPEDVYANLYTVRKVRNKLVHEGKMVAQADALQLYYVVNELFKIAIHDNSNELLPKIFLEDKCIDFT